MASWKRCFSQSQYFSHFGRIPIKKQPSISFLIDYIDMNNMWNRLRAGYRAFQSPIAQANTRNQYESWWFKHGPKLNNSWLERFCEFHKIPPLQFISCFNKRESIHLSKNLKNVFFAPENLNDRFKTFEDFMIGEVDFSMGFEELEHPKYLRFPLWLLYFTAPNTKDPGKEFVAKFSS